MAFALLRDDGRFLQVQELGRGKTFDVLLTANGFDHALLGAPGEHGQRFRQQGKPRRMPAVGVTKTDASPPGPPLEWAFC